ncbi:hypothetical protein FNW54_06715 [Bacteroides sp. HF-5092]|nr:hypothetical protein FNW54_06715 [Bacteroides sp. HF-5092]
MKWDWCWHTQYTNANFLIEVEKIVTLSSKDSDAIVVIYRHYPYWIASLFYKGNSPTTFLN